MHSEFHQRARYLLDRSLVEGIALEEQRWLDTHLAQCADCARHAELSRRTLEALDSFAFPVDPVVASRVEREVRARADEMAARGFAIGIPVAIALTIFGSLAMWALAAWLAARWNVPAPLWHMAFATFWLLPSVVLDLVLLFRGRFIGDFSEEGETI